MHTNTQNDLSYCLHLETADLPNVVGDQTKGDLRPAIRAAFGQVESNLRALELSQMSWTDPWLDLIY